MSDPAFDNELRELSDASARLREELGTLQQRIEKLEALREPAQAAPAMTPAPHEPLVPLPEPSQPEPEPDTPPEPPPQTPDTPPFARIPGPAPEHSVPPLSDDVRDKVAAFRNRFTSSTTPPSERARDTTPNREQLELLIGRTWLNRAGALILFLSIAFFAKYSFDQGWISPTMRILGAAAIGLGMVVFGEYSLYREMRSFATGVLGCAVAVLYLSVYGAHGFYGLVGASTASFLYMAVTALSVAISMHGRLLPVAVIAAVGGYATPIVLSTGENRQVELMTYLLALDVGFLACGLFRRWDVLRVMAWIGTFLLFAGWYGRFYDDSVMWRTTGFLFAFYLIFHTEALLCVRRAASRLPQAMGHCLRANNVVFFATTYFLLRHDLPSWMGLFAVSTAAAQWLLAWRVCGRAESSSQARQALWHDGAAMLALAAPMQFDRYMVSVSWSVQSVVTLWFARRQASYWLRLKSAGVLLAAIAHLIMFEYADAELTTPFVTLGHWHLSWMILCFVFSGLCAYGGAAMLLVRRRDAGADRDLAVGFAIVGTLLLLAIFANQWERYVATWWWMGLAMVWWGLSYRVPAAGAMVLALAAAVFAKVLLWDTGQASTSGFLEDLHGIAFNRMVVTGVLAACMGALARKSVRRLPESLVHAQDATTAMCTLTVLIALVITWTGTVEIIRAFRFEASLAEYFGNPRAAGGVFITGFWALNAAALWTIARVDRPVVTVCAGVLTALTILKLMLTDTVVTAGSGRWSQLVGIGTNRTFVVGMLVLAVAMYAHARYRRMVLQREPAGVFHPGARIALLIAATLLITWVPTFEICRVFRFEPFRQQFDDPRLAMHVALSVFWSLNATGILLAGFARCIGPLRHLALGLFGLTVVKVLFFDLGHLEMVYRIISFAVLGVLLMFASLLYQRLSERLLQPPAVGINRGS